jgi:hypothetical protein
MSGSGHRVAVITGASQGIGTGLHGMPRDPGCIDVSASAAVEAAGDRRHAVTCRSDEGDGAAALDGARRSRRRPSG